MTTTPPLLDHAREELTSTKRTALTVARARGTVEIVETAASLWGTHQFPSPPKGDAGAQPVTTALRLPAGEISTFVELLPILPLGAQERRR
jgi:hypothetical protein